MIQPTVGRVVWYHPPLHHTQPLAAIVAHVWSDTMVNLMVIDPEGNPFGRTSVFLYQGDTDRPSGEYAEWMPYQKGQAAKTEVLEAKVAESGDAKQ